MSDYINNKEFYKMLCEFKDECIAAEESGKPTPRIPEKIGNCFVMIATKLSTKSNFVGYSYKDEMISDALENCVVAVHSFNPEKSKNPFAYFTQIIWYAFLRRIEKEKKQTFIKYKSLEKVAMEELFQDSEGELYSSFDLQNEKMKPIIEKFDKPKKPKKAVGLEKFIDE